MLMLSTSSSSNFLRLIDLDELRRLCAESSTDSDEVLLTFVGAFEVGVSVAVGKGEDVLTGVLLFILAMRSEMRFDDGVVGTTTGVDG